MNDKPYLVANQMSGGPGQYITDLVADKSNRIEHNGGEPKSLPRSILPEAFRNKVISGVVYV
jgi:hypothetical protein